MYEIFFGDVAAFLRQEKQVFNDLRELLDCHFDRLSNAEREVMWWLAINREPVSLTKLQEDLLSPEAKNCLPSTLQSLERRIPLEKSKTGFTFTVQPVLIEYLTDRLIEGLYKVAPQREDKA